MIPAVLWAFLIIPAVYFCEKDKNV